MKAEFWRDKALPYVESRRACDSRICYQEHSHPTFSIGAVDSGGSVFTGAPGGPARSSLHLARWSLFPRTVATPATLCRINPGAIRCCIWMQHG